MSDLKKFKNPFRPGAGHPPPYLAGRQTEHDEFHKLLQQDVILQNCIITGLRGVGKTVLLESLKPLALQAGWLWAGTDLSESTSVSEDHLATRIITDLSIVTAPITQPPQLVTKDRHHAAMLRFDELDYRSLRRLFDMTPGLVYDKLKTVLDFVWTKTRTLNKRGIVFAYDEAQNLSDHAAKQQYPLSLLLDVFQSLQRRDIPVMLVLTGLPTLLGKLVETRTYTERMFHVITLQPLSLEATREAVERGIKKAGSPFGITPESMERIWSLTRGYPFLVQFVCRELFDVWVQAVERGEEPRAIPEDAILSKLDADFFAGRWETATDRQKELLTVIAWLENSDKEFTVQEIVDKSRQLFARKPFSNSNVNQMLSILGDRGLVYKKTQHGKYSFAVPLLDQFIMRQLYAGIILPGEGDSDDDLSFLDESDE